ncbi:MAG TPA: TonB-dependent receptor [Pyrinomonadaceae bacterium]|nr:TonB-dependent receptor [Pyrinomonadaceae bacterium]
MKRAVLTPICHLPGGSGHNKLGRCCTSLIILSLSLLLFQLWSPSATAQTTTSTVEGTVTDANGAVIAGAEVKATATALASERTTATDSEGFYRLTALPAGTYILTVSRTGFATSSSNIELTLNRVVTFNIKLQVGNIAEEVVSVDVLPLLEQNTSATGATITPRQITELPVNGRDYLDLLQLVPGVAINRQADPDDDEANPVLGERSGNNNFFIDGLPNKDTVEGGPAAQFNQETIAEFQVLTTGYKAEFGQASGAIVNVITKSGGNGYHGVASLFHRNDAFDASNSLDPTKPDAPPLRRFDYSLAGGGPIIKDKIFFFGSSERITEKRRLNFNFPDTGSQVVNTLLRDQETRFDNPTRLFETRNFLKLDEQFGRHHLTQQINYTNRVIRDFLPLSQSGSLPSARNDSGARHLLLGFGDTMLLGESGNPWVVTLRGAYRGEPSDTRPSHPEVQGSTRFNPFSSNTTGTFFGDFPTVVFGNIASPTNLDQKYTSFSGHAGRLFGNHDLKFGYNFLRTKVDGVESQLLQNQLFATVDDFATFGPQNAGFFTITTAGGFTPEANEIHLRNNYHALFVQDDWKLRSNITLNLGLRWDYDSEFVTKKNFSPRLGATWAVTPRTIVRGHFGVFYDQFRLGLARDVPSFGGADRRVFQPFFYPRGFYGVPTLVVALVNSLLFPPNGLCISPNLTDAQIASMGATCPFGGPFVGIDRLNGVVAAGHAPIPANSVINAANIQTLSGLTPDQFAAQASAAVGQPTGFFFFSPSGVLTHGAVPPQPFPTSIDESFKTPHTLGFSAGVQRQIGNDMVVEADYYHRDIRNLLGVRESNIDFAARVLGRRYLEPFPSGPITTFGPFYEGNYDAFIVSFNRRFSRRFLVGGNYSFAHATDNWIASGILPSDSFIGIVPEVTDPDTGQSNQNGSFISQTGAFVAQAGTFLNGPDLDKGPSDLALDHIFQINGLVGFPWQIQVSGIFRAQSGFHFSRDAAVTEDPDGNGTFNSIDHGPGGGRNAFTAPPYVNLDMRFSKRFNVGERVKVQLLFEFFNLFNRQNPAAVSQSTTNVIQPFGEAIQVLPGREGQVGLRIEF